MTHPGGVAAAGRGTRGAALVREYVEAVLVAVVFALFAKAFLVETYQIPSGSMEESLLVGDHVVVDKLGWAPRKLPWGPILPSRGIRRGDVVVFRGPEEPGRDFIKRAVALPGETVEIRDKRIVVDGVVQEEPWVVHRDPAVLSGEGLPASLRGRDELAPRTLPARRLLRARRQPRRVPGLAGTRPGAAGARPGPGPLRLLVRPAPRGADPGPQRSPSPSPRRRDTRFSRTRWERTFRAVG